MPTYFMRHGQTNYNLLRLCNDDPTRDVHLSPEGIRQAEAASERLRSAGLQRIIVSPLPRTRQTAEIINRHHGCEIIIQPQIADIRTGFDSRPVADYQAAIAHDPLHAVPPGGESVLQHKARVLDFLAWLERQPPCPTLVVAHEETLRVFIGHYQGLDDAAMHQLSIGNCEYVCFDVPAAYRSGRINPPWSNET